MASPALIWKQRKSGIRQSQRSAEVLAVKSCPAIRGRSGAQANIPAAPKAPSTAVRFRSLRANNSVDLMPLTPSRKNLGNAAAWIEVIGTVQILTTRYAIE